MTIEVRYTDDFFGHRAIAHETVVVDAQTPLELPQPSDEGPNASGQDDAPSGDTAAVVGETTEGTGDE